MIKLMTLLTECFYTSQWLDVLQKYPQIIDLLKNDAEINRHNSLFGFKIKNWDDMDEISSSIAHLVGYCGLDADSNFNLKDIKSFFFCFSYVFLLILNFKIILFYFIINFLINSACFSLCKKKKLVSIVVSNIFSKLIKFSSSTVKA